MYQYRVTPLILFFARSYAFHLRGVGSGGVALGAGHPLACLLACLTGRPSDCGSQFFGAASGGVDPSLHLVGIYHQLDKIRPPSDTGP